jgi:hypothetical protein
MVDRDGVGCCWAGGGSGRAGSAAVVESGGFYMTDKLIRMELFLE